MVDRGKPIRVVMVGTDPSAMGGVASVIRGYLDVGFGEQVTVTQLTSHVDGPGWRKIKAFLGCLPRFILGCARSEWDVVHLHTSEGASFLRKSLLAGVARAFRTPVVMHFHTGRIEAIAAGGTVLPKRFVLAVLRRVDRVVVLTPATAAAIAESVGPKRVVVVPNGVRLPRQEARVLTGPILYLGLISEAKGAFDLIAAFARSQGERLVLAGNGEVERARDLAIELGVGDRVDLPGWVGPAERDSLLGDASMFALVSHSEGMPMALLEAMASGLPVLVSAVGSMPEIVEHGVTGLVVQPGDVASIALAIDRLAGSSAKRTEMGRAGRERIASSFSVESSVQGLLRIYRELATAPNGA